MLEVHVNINREQTLATLHAVRTKPKSKKVREGTICTYNIVYEGVTVGSMEGAYGCGINLAIKLLEEYKKNQYIYKMIMLHELGEKDGTIQTKSNGN